MMKTAGLFLLCLVSIPAQSSRLPQTDSLALKSQRAKQLMAEGKFVQAVSLYRELNQAVPNDAGLMLNLGMALHMAGRKREAIPELEAAVKYDPGLAPAWLFLGTAHLQLGETTAAVKALKVVLELQPDHREARQMLAGALLSLDRVDEAVAEIYRQTGHPDWADSEEKKELQLPSLDCRALTPECHFWARHYNELIAMAKAKTADSFYWRSRAYNELALDAFTRLGQLPPSAELHELKARIYNSQKRYSEAAGEWREALKLSTADAQIQKQLAISLKLSQDYRAALPLLQGLLRQQPTSAELNYLVGDTLLDQQRVEEAIPLLKRAVSRDPKFLAAHKSLARADLAAGKAIEAIPHLKAALPTDDDGSLHYQLAQAYQASGQPELAKKILVDYQMIQRSAAAAREAAKRATEITPP